MLSSLSTGTLSGFRGQEMTQLDGGSVVADDIDSVTNSDNRLISSQVTTQSPLRSLRCHDA